MEYSEKVTTKGITLTDEFISILEKLENTSSNFFITGNAGTGKSTIIELFRAQTKKNIVILAPTGLAANNVRGQTIHSFFRFPPKLMDREAVQNIRVYGDLYQKIDTIIIDEASMVRADLLDAVDMFLRAKGRDPFLPFGGIQVILVGDLFQLPPVVTHQEIEYITEKYDSPYFFAAHAYDGSFETATMNHIFRQEDENFITVLNNIRKGSVSQDDLDFINTRVTDTEHPTSVTLTSINKIADSINNRQLNQLESTSRTYVADMDGEMRENENNLRIPIELELKKGARVMFTRNSDEWVNGSLGEVVNLDDSIIVKLDDGDEVEVGKEKWEKIKYSYDKERDEIKEETVWSMKQFPLRLAYAITIHKSQGMTFENININLQRAPFTHGQTYVALSRAKSLKGLHLSRELRREDVITDTRIVEFG